MTELSKGSFMGTIRFQGSDPDLNAEITGSTDAGVTAKWTTKGSSGVPVTRTVFYPWHRVREIELRK